MDHNYDVVGGYIHSFIQHLQATSTRLGLRTKSQVNEGQATARDTPEEEYAETTTTDTGWTPAEQDAFFRAISVHSRWRPDLIAACVPTKSEWDVWMYLDALEEGAARVSIQQGDEDEHGDMDVEDGSIDERQDVDHVAPVLHSHSDSDVDAELCEPALEVSQAWIDAEERMASWIIEEEHRAAVEDALGKEDTMCKPRKRKRRRGRRRGSEEEPAQNLSQAQVVSTKGSSSPPPRYALREATSTSKHDASQDHSALHTRKREILMGRLQVPHLQVLDRILREGEGTMNEQNESREGSVTTAAMTRHGDDGAPRDTDVLSLSGRITGPQETRHVPESSSNVVIDPILLALSGGTDPVGCRSGQGTSESAVASSPPVQAPAQSPSSSPNDTLQHGSPEASSQLGMFTVVQDNTLSNPDSTGNAESDLSLLSPRTRRRVQKRLYMRRKRALLRGDGAASEEVLDTGIEKLKPGKRPRLERSEIPGVSTSVPCSKAPSDADGETPENARKQNKPGLTLPYKLRAQFAALGVDATYLRGQGMDLLNLGVLGKLMGLYSPPVESEEAVKLASTDSIDAELIRYLQVAVISFVTDIIHRAIVWKEREIRMKQRNRAWRLGDQITVGAVEHAVEVIGARYHSHKAHLRALEEAHYDLSTEGASTAANAVTEPSSRETSVDPSVGVTDLLSKAPGLSVHREVYTPVICPPSAWRTSLLGCLTRTYEREATRTRRGASAELEEDELMSDETDEDALEADLEDEEEVDAQDMALAATYEQSLWVRLDK